MEQLRSSLPIYSTPPKEEENIPVACWEQPWSPQTSTPCTRRQMEKGTWPTPKPSPRPLQQPVRAEGWPVYPEACPGPAYPPAADVIDSAKIWHDGRNRMAFKHLGWQLFLTTFIIFLYHSNSLFSICQSMPFLPYHITHMQLLRKGILKIRLVSFCVCPNKGNHTLILLQW